jgi:ADP-heptose:LPS heptosyltransferase
MSSDLAQFYRRTRNARKVIVVDLGFLGDTVHLVPALWEIRHAYPQAALHVLTTSVGAELLQLAPCVDHAWPMDLDPARRSLSAQWQMIRAVRRERFNVAFNFSGTDRTLFLTALSGARWRVAYPGGRWHFYNRWLVREWAPRQDPDRVIFEQRRQMLAACGVPLNAPRFDLKLDEASLAWASKIVPPMAVHVSVNSAKTTREWPLENHSGFFKRVWSEFPEMRFLASGSTKPREQERLRLLAESVKDPRLELLPAGLTIRQLAAVLTRCRLHLGPDSGVLHLAVALDVPTISFFREQGAYKSFMPSGQIHKVISVPCHCIDGRQAPCEALGRSECFAQIDPARVAALAREQFAKDLPRKAGH